MSKFAVKGAATGTGTFTLESPATNTDRTFTLPDTDGSFITADGSGNVTISGGLTLTSGTANGVTYLNGGKQVTSGSAFTFDGTTVGINTTIGNSTSLSITGDYTSNNVATFIGVQRVGGAVAGAWSYSDLLGSIQFGTTTNHSLVFLQNNAEAMRLTSTSLYTASGINVGIGTSSPGAQLQLNRLGTGDYTTFRLSNSGASGKTYEIGVGGNTSAAGYANNLYFYDSTASALRMVLDSSGNVGIGISSPAAPLDVFKASQGGTATFRAYGPAGQILWANGGTSTSYLDSDTIVFRKSSDGGNTERLRIDSSGNLGLGVTPSAWAGVYKAMQLNTYGAIASDTSKKVNISSNVYAYAQDLYAYLANDYATLYQQFAGKHIWSNAPAGSAAGTAATFTPTMTLTAAGDLAVGTTSPGAKLELYSTANANFGQKIYHNSSSLGTHRFPQIEFAQTPVGQSYQNTVILRQQNSDYGNYPSLALITNAAGAGEATRMFVDGYTGNVGIGTSSPASKLDVSGSGDTRISVRNNDVGVVGTVRTFIDLYGKNTANDVKLQATVGSSPGLNASSGGCLVLYTNDSSSASQERVRIDEVGNLLVGYTSGNSKLNVNGAGWLSGGVYPSSTGADNSRIFDSTSGTTGTVTLYIGNAAITTSSDVRLKENIVNTQRNATEIIQQLRVVDHTWNDPSDTSVNNRNSRGVWMGLIAQEAQPIIPWLVNKPLADEDEKGNPQYWHMDYGYAVPLLVKAIQEQQAIIEQLQADVATLKGAA
jgi:hypothetical protein